MNYPQPPVPQAMPSLSPGHANTPSSAAVGATPRSLLDLMSDGFYLLMLLKRGQLPSNESSFVESIQRFLETTERGAIKLNIGSEDIYAAKYAFCAAVDEAILSQMSPLREDWERNPLQLRLFGEHLAGEHFFDRLEQLRAQGATRLSSLEVYHYCLLLGFEGKYRLEGPEKLGYLTARLGDEIAYLKGKRAGFSPHWAPPDRVQHVLRKVTPLWAPVAVAAGAGVLAFVGIGALLGRDAGDRLAQPTNVVGMPAATARLTITLP